MFRKLDDKISVAPQITTSDVGQAARLGFTCIINNRPEGESPDQTPGAEIAAAASAAGLSYLAIPITHSGFSEQQVLEMEAALEGASGPVLAYCRSGTRSTFLWALARARMGDTRAELTEKAAAAGYDVGPVLGMR